jgi:hypothetical protein
MGKSVKDSFIDKMDITTSGQIHDITTTVDKSIKDSFIIDQTMTMDVTTHGQIRRRTAFIYQMDVTTSGQILITTSGQIHQGLLY